MIKILENYFRRYFPKHLKNKNKYNRPIKNLYGIEIGGPSQVFSSKGLLPVYPIISGLDGCNFSNNTVWEGKLYSGNTYKYASNKKPGQQFICEGNDLSMVADNTYDFVLSSHNLEHFANPVKALYEWKRVVKNNGYLIIVLPHKDKTFDHNRPVTKLFHLIDDFKNNVTEHDPTHFEEIINLHDIDKDAGVSDIDELAERLKNNFDNRCAHHHVFNEQIVGDLLKYAGFEILELDTLQINIFAIVKNLK